MKNYLVILAALYSTTSLAGQTIVCTHQLFETTYVAVVATKLSEKTHDGRSRYSIEVHENMAPEGVNETRSSGSTGYDKDSDSIYFEKNGAVSGELEKMKKGFLNSPVGTQSEAKITFGTVWGDSSQEQLECTIYDSSNPATPKLDQVMETRARVEFSKDTEVSRFLRGTVEIQNLRMEKNIESLLNQKRFGCNDVNASISYKRGYLTDVMSASVYAYCSRIKNISLTLPADGQGINVTYTDSNNVQTSELLK